MKKNIESLQKGSKGHREIPCRAGFAPANPLLVRPIPHNFALKRTQSTDGRFDLHSGFCLVINQFGFNEFSGAVPDAVRAAYPFHLVGRFECLGDTFGCRHLTYQMREQFFRLMVYISKVFIQLAACQQTSIGSFAMFFQIPAVTLSSDTDMYLCFLRQPQTR